MKLYLIDWDNGLIGGFYADSLEQAFNTDKILLDWSIKHFMEVNDVKSIEIEFLNNHEELNELRKKIGVETKPLALF